MNAARVSGFDIFPSEIPFSLLFRVGPEGGQVAHAFAQQPGRIADVAPKGGLFEDGGRFADDFPVQNAQIGEGAFLVKMPERVLSEPDPPAVPGVDADQVFPSPDQFLPGSCFADIRHAAPFFSHADAGLCEIVTTKNEPHFAGFAHFMSFISAFLHIF